ncbi:hypothetical protein [Streptomyces sp. NPDC059076]|uniref:hypothetical protein n=1 Tax=unclassified Streptomyces TaxID=2593676 RepID=UPI0036869675
MRSRQVGPDVSDPNIVRLQPPPFCADILADFLARLENIREDFRTRFEGCPPTPHPAALRADEEKREPVRHV